MITNAQSQLAADLELDAEESFAEYQSNTISQSKALVKCTQEMVSKSKSSPKEMFAKAKNVTATYCKLVETTQYCLATIESDQVRFPHECQECTTVFFSSFLLILYAGDFQLTSCANSSPSSLVWV